MVAKDNEREQRFEAFLTWFRKHCTGDEKGEGQIFFERLLQAFGNAGVKEAGATCEERIKRKKGTTGFADLFWKPRVIVELKKRGEPLQKHYNQAFEYWLQSVPNRPKFMVLCNFDEFWIYDLNTQLNDPVHVLKTENLAKDWFALSFLFPKEEKPIFNNNNVEVTEKAAGIVGSIYKSMIGRKIEPEKAQRFVLQLVVAMFSEDVNLIPKNTLLTILKASIDDPVTQKELTLLFKAMATKKDSEKPSKYKSIPYFNGGLFTTVDAVELKFKEISLLHDACSEDWSKVRPSIFGSIFESTMDEKERHGHGIHYTSELDIQKIVTPTIVRPFQERIEKAKTKKEYAKILHDIRDFKVLDPACGSGNFLYVAFRELRRLEADVMDLMGRDKSQMAMGWISPKNFYGIDTNKFGLELAKVALSIGRKLAADEFNLADNVLPFEDLDNNFISEDALFVDWPKANAIIGNPPYLSAKKMKVEFDVEYVNKVRKMFKGVPGRADYCVYWFRKAHDNLSENGRAGLVGTNTIRENYSREGGLDYILANQGTITEAVSTQVWSGDAVVHVSIVNWIKGSFPGKKRLSFQRGDKTDSPWELFELDKIPAALTNEIDVTSAKVISVNRTPKKCFQGQTLASKGFLLTPAKAKEFVKKESKSAKILFPFLIGREFVSKERLPRRYVIDLGEKNLIEASSYKDIFKHLEETVFKDVEKKAAKELKKEKKEGDWCAHKKTWWHHWRGRPDLISAISKLDRMIVVSRHTKRPTFDFVSTKIRPGDALVVFAFDDDYSFGIIQSKFHWDWFKAKCSTIKRDWRYTGDTVFDTFPFPQAPRIETAEKVSKAARALREFRNQAMEKNSIGLKDLYISLEKPGENPLRALQDALDEAVREAYGFSNTGNPLTDLLQLNLEVTKKATEGKAVQGPGLPACVKDPSPFISKDCVKIDT